MATVVIIHAADDTLPARALAEKLRQAKLTVVLEKEGADLQEALRSAQATVALWSPRSVGAIEGDVQFARGKSKLVHALMQNTPMPDAFRGDKSANLTGWRGEDDFPGWRDLAKLVTERAGVAPLPPPAPRVASGFFQPGKVDPAVANAAGATQQGRPAQRRATPPPPPRAAPAQQSAPRPAAPRTAALPRDYAPEPQREKKGGGMMIAIIALVALAAGGGGGYYWWSQQQGASAASTAWESVDRNNPRALRAFIAAQTGPLKTQAQTVLAQLEERSYEAAMDSDSPDQLQAFLRDFQGSPHELEIRGRMATLQAAAADQPPPQATTDTSLPTSTDTSTATVQTPSASGPTALTPPAAETTTQEPQTSQPPN